MLDLRRILPASALAALCTAPTAQGAVLNRSATMAGGSFAEYDQINQSTGSLVLDRTRAYDGTQSARATFAGGANGYERGVYNVDWHDGDEVWYGAAFYLPAGFKAAMQGQVDIMRWDNWGHFGDYDDRSGVVIHRNGMANLMRMKFGVENVDIGPAFDVPEDRWFWLEVHQRLNRTDGAALSEVYLDGVRVAATSSANTYGRGVDRVRYGIVAIDAARQLNPLTLWFDRATVSTSQVGPLGSSPARPIPVTTPTPAPVTPTVTQAIPPASPTGAVPPAKATTTATSVPSAMPGAGANASVEVAKGAGGAKRFVDRAAGRPTTASSRRSAEFPSRAATDTSKHTRWASRPRSRQWWRVDLGRVRALSQVRTAWGRASASRYVVQLSRDGHRWWNAGTGRSARSTITRTRLSARARYVQIHAVARDAHVGISLRSVRVLGPAAR